MRSYLVVGNQTLGGPELAAAIAERIASGPSQFHVVVPATPVGGGLTWDEDDARAAAQSRVEATVVQIQGLGVEATGEVGHRDPVEAARDAIRRHPVDEVILSTLPAGISRWLGQDAPSRLKGAVTVPVVVVTAQRVPVETEAG